MEKTNQQNETEEQKSGNNVGKTAQPAKAQGGKKAPEQKRELSKKEIDDQKREEKQRRDDQKRKRHQDKIRLVTEDMSTEVIVVNTHETSAFAMISSQADLAVSKIRKMMGLGALDFQKAATALKEEQDLMLAFHHLTKKICKLGDITYRTPWLVKQLLEAKEKEARREANALAAAAKIGSNAAVPDVADSSIGQDELEEEKKVANA